jgi:UDP-4-amino-4,6-dideoxy-N-acetyl-beta-L-altrosamine transaminase
MIPYGRQSIDNDDIEAVVAVMKSDWLTQGPAVAEFEAALCEMTGARHAVAFCNGTGALHAAAAATGLGPGDVVATSPLSFVASANCARYVGATPTFVDVDPSTLNLDVSAIGGCEGVVAVHFAGLPADLAHLASRPRVVIEDAAHAIGAATPEGPVGNCAHSDACAFSFHPVKTITTGEGGAVTTNSTDVAEALRTFRTHGMVARRDVEGWYYEVGSVGFNYRMSDIQAALGSSQLRRLTRFVERRGEIAQRYRDELGQLPLTLPPEAPPGWRHAYHLFPIRVADRRRVYAALRARGIGVQVHYIPIYRHPTFASLDIDPARYPATEAAYSELLSLPIFPNLRDGEQSYVIAALREVL